MINLDDCVLIIVDVQEKLRLVMSERDKLVKNLSILVQGAKVLGIPVISCRQYPQAIGDTIPEIKEHLGDISPVDKRCFSCAASDEFMEKLKASGAKHCIVCGIESHVCVYQTVRDLQRLGFHTHVPVDGIASRISENKQVAVERMRHEGAILTSVEMVLFELLQTSEHPDFRTISKLIK
ncbi:MAG: hydrolase [Sedimentisphaeraceae bacterium JB056]